jgi:hypothetical protein
MQLGRAFGHLFAKAWHFIFVHAQQGAFSLRSQTSPELYTCLLPLQCRRGHGPRLPSRAALCQRHHRGAPFETCGRGKVRPFICFIAIFSLLFRLESDCLSLRNCSQRKVVNSNYSILAGVPIAELARTSFKHSKDIDCAELLLIRWFLI